MRIPPLIGSFASDAAAAGLTFVAKPLNPASFCAQLRLSAWRLTSSGGVLPGLHELVATVVGPPYPPVCSSESAEYIDAVGRCDDSAESKLRLRRRGPEKSADAGSVW